MTVSLVIIGILCLVGLGVLGTHWRPGWWILGGIAALSILAGAAWLWPHVGPFWPLLLCSLILLGLLGASLMWPRLLPITGIVAAVMLVVGWFWLLIRFEAYSPLILPTTVAIGLLVAAHVMSQPGLRTLGLALLALTAVGTVVWLLWGQREPIWALIVALWPVLLGVAVLVLIIAGFRAPRCWAIAAWLVGMTVGMVFCWAPNQFLGIEDWARQWPTALSLLLLLMVFVPVQPQWARLAFSALLLGPLVITLVIQTFSKGAAGGLYLIFLLAFFTFLARWARGRLAPRTTA